MIMKINGSEIFRVLLIERYGIPSNRMSQSEVKRIWDIMLDNLLMDVFSGEDDFKDFIENALEEFETNG